jgi:hypothetical protein
MPPIKKPIRKSLPKKKKATSGMLFKFLDDITYTKTNILTNSNVSEYTKYMIIKFLSVKSSYLPICDILNQHGERWDSFQFHKFCIEVIPKKKVFFKYGDIKGTLLLSKHKDKVEIISNHFGVTYDEAFEYYKICGDDLVKDIQELYGIVK